MDFVSDSLANGRRLKCLTVADDFSHECVDIAVDYGISGEYVTRLLDRAAVFRGYPAAVRTDNGPEFTSRAFIAWAQRHHIRHLLIEPGRPMQNGYIESFNGKFRDECLNEHWFQTLAQARQTIAAWRRDYNEVRPHSSIGRIAPARFAEQHRHPGDHVTFNQDSFRITGMAEGGKSRPRRQRSGSLASQSTAAAASLAASRGARPAGNGHAISISGSSHRIAPSHSFA
ncbi:ribosome modulation factor [Rubrivivax gelatinosus]|nr:ribosome modulation factor [Rubrivivax gelatinosus]